MNATAICVVVVAVVRLFAYLQWAIKKRRRITTFVRADCLTG